jgi:hypothetical protein
MDIIKLLPEYLDLGVDQDELVAIALAALAKRIRDVKLATAEAVVQARACILLDNLEGSHQALQRARQLQREYHHFFAEWQRLVKPSGGAACESGVPGNIHVLP